MGCKRGTRACAWTRSTHREFYTGSFTRVLHVYDEDEDEEEDADAVVVVAVVAAGSGCGCGRF